MRAPVAVLMAAVALGGCGQSENDATNLADRARTIDEYVALATNAPGTQARCAPTGADAFDCTVTRPGGPSVLYHVRTWAARRCMTAWAADLQSLMVSEGVASFSHYDAGKEDCSADAPMDLGSPFGP